MAIDYETRAAVVIGVNRYRDPRYSSLAGACNDARLFATTLVENCGVSRGNVTLLLDEEATLKGIRQTIETVANTMPRLRSQLIVYFAGHGDTINVLGKHPIGVVVPHDGVKANLWSTCLSMGDVIPLSDLIPAHHVLFVFDCCFSGLAGRFPRGVFVNQRPKRLLDVRCRQILVAGLSDEAAIEDTRFQHGVFTLALCDLLRDPTPLGDSHITASALHHHLATTVASNTSGAQNPQLRQLVEFGEGDNFLRERLPRPEPERRPFSRAFEDLYGDADLYRDYCTDPPTNLSCILPFEESDVGPDEPDLLAAERDVLAEVTPATVRRCVEMLAKYGLLDEPPDHLLSVADFFDQDFYYEVLGTAYSNAALHKRALRWFREFVDLQPSSEGVAAAVGHSLYWLGHCHECVAWTHACIGIHLIRDSVYGAVVGKHFPEGSVPLVERGGRSVRYRMETNPYAARVSVTTLQRMGRYLSRRVPGVTFDVVDVGVESELRPLAGRGQPRIDRDGSGFAVHRANLIHALYELASHASEPRGALAYLDQVLLIAPEWSLARRLYDDTKRLIA